MKKYVKIGIILVIALSLIIPFTIVNATTEEEENETVEFLTVTSRQVTLSDKIELVLNIENISYTNFTLTLTSKDLDFSSLKVSSDGDKEDDGESEKLEGVESEVETTEEENTLVITISNSTLSKIVIQIDLPDGATVGDIYEIVGTIVNNDNEEDDEIENIVEIEVVESSDTSDFQSTDNFQDSQTENSSFDNNSMTSSNNDSSNFSSFSSQDSDSSNNMSSSLSSERSSSTSSTETTSLLAGNTITYNGSSNNYLSELSIDGYDLNKTFSKESQTYFATVGSDVDLLTINATAEDDGATVHIYGNTDLQTGENKILISVYAENGNERVYKIIVTKEA